MSNGSHVVFDENVPFLHGDAHRIGHLVPMRTLHVRCAVLTQREPTDACATAEEAVVTAVNVVCTPYEH